MKGLLLFVSVFIFLFGSSQSKLKVNFPDTLNFCEKDSIRFSLQEYCENATQFEVNGKPISTGQYYITLRKSSKLIIKVYGANNQTALDTMYANFGHFLPKVDFKYDPVEGILSPTKVVFVSTYISSENKYGWKFMGEDGVVEPGPTWMYFIYEYPKTIERRDYVVTHIVVNGCGASSIKKTITVGPPVGIDERPKNEELEVFFNSLNETIIIKRKNNSRGVLKLYDVNGRHLLSKNIEGREFNIGKKSLSKGVYFYLVKESSGKVLSGKFIIP